MPKNVEAKIQWLKGQIWSRETWLEDHAEKWSKSDVEMKQYGLEMMQDICADYELSLEKAKARGS